MAFNPAVDVKILVTKRSLMTMGNGSVPSYEIHFSIRGEGDYAVKVPAEGYTSQIGIQAVLNVAKEIVDTIDAFNQ
jgi:hypothetical protein